MGGNRRRQKQKKRLKGTETAETAEAREDALGVAVAHMKCINCTSS